MVYKYGELPSKQIIEQKEYLKNAIYQLLCFKEEGYEFLDNRFVSLQHIVHGMSLLFNDQPVFLTIAGLLEDARIEPDFNEYRKCIFDAITCVELIKDGESCV